MDERDVEDILKDKRCVEGKRRKVKWKACVINTEY
jgi:hypothetical protein